MDVDALTLPHMAHGTAVCTVAKLNVRAEPTPNAAIAGVLVASELVTVWAVEAGWLLVQAVNGLTGWAVAPYLAIQGALIP